MELFPAFETCAWQRALLAFAFQRGLALKRRAWAQHGRLKHICNMREEPGATTGGIIHIGSMRKGAAPIGGDYIYDI